MALAMRSARAVEQPVADAFKRHWWIVAITWALTLAATAFFTSRQVPVYRASTSLAVAPDAGLQDAADVLRSLDTLDRRTIIATFARLPSTPESREEAARLLRAPLRELADYTVLAGVTPNTNIIRIDVEGPDAARAAELSNALAVVVSRRAPELYRIFTLQVIERAVPRSRPVRPDMRRNVVVGAIVGLLLGAAAAAGGYYLRRKAAAI
ncbi:MAG TPA: hypothetical protein VK886_00040 [Vicinamibacterales bacterium]|nr:hypothetical protein [Vicinamibacterales bacterium]